MTLSSLGVILALGGLLTLVGAIVTLTLRRGDVRGAQWVDCALIAGVAAVIGGRAGHVLLQWGYFADHTDEIVRFTAGGTNAEFALLAGTFGLLVGGRWRHVPDAVLLDAFALALPVLMMAGWIGCATAVCGWGKEVTTLADFPSWAVSWSRDIYSGYAPRYNTQGYGLAWGALWLIVGGVMIWRRWGVGRRYWLLVAGVSLGMALIGFWRADPVPILLGVRADQGVALVTAAWGLALFTMTRLKASRRSQ